jgi:hypothetical protein
MEATSAPVVGEYREWGNSPAAYDYCEEWLKTKHLERFLRDSVAFFDMLLEIKTSVSWIALHGSDFRPLSRKLEMQKPIAQNVPALHFRRLEPPLLRRIQRQMREILARSR